VTTDREDRTGFRAQTGAERTERAAPVEEPRQRMQVRQPSGGDATRRGRGHFQVGGGARGLGGFVRLTYGGIDVPLAAALTPADRRAGCVYGSTARGG
jgi:hypothetical protein